MIMDEVQKSIARASVDIAKEIANVVSSQVTAGRIAPGRESQVYEASIKIWLHYQPKI